MVGNLRRARWLASLSCERSERLAKAGGEAGIRTLGTGLSPYNGLANRRFRPLSHLTARLQVYVTEAPTPNLLNSEVVQANRVQIVA